MQQYHALLQDILQNGHDRADRTGVGTRGVFGRQMRFDLEKGFPLLTTKRLHCALLLCAQNRYRAIETGLPMVRAANRGASGIVDGYGRETMRTLPAETAPEGWSRPVSFSTTEARITAS